MKYYQRRELQLDVEDLWIQSTYVKHTPSEYYSTVQCPFHARHCSDTWARKNTWEENKIIKWFPPGKGQEMRMDCKRVSREFSILMVV